MRGRRIAVVALRTAVALLATVVLVGTGYGFAVYRGVSDGLVTSTALGDRPPAGLDEAFTALLVGIDTRTDAAGNPLPPEVLAELRAGEDEGQFNTDTIMLLHVPAGSPASASAVSIPRDSFVELADGLGDHKINSAYRRGMSAAEDAGVASELVQREAGRRALVGTVEALTGVTVDHFAEVTLAGFVEITDAVGGVPVCLNAAVQEERAGIDLPAGRQIVSGSDALAFVRQRRDLPEGDLDRVTRQQAFLAGLARTALAPGALADPARVDALVRAFPRYVVLDRGWDLERLVAQLRRTAGSEISFTTIPTGRPDLETPVDGEAVEIDPEQVQAFVAGIVGDAGPAAPTTVRTRPVPLGPAAEPSTTAPAPPTAPAPTTAPEPITAETVPCVD